MSNVNEESVEILKGCGIKLEEKRRGFGNASRFVDAKNFRGIAIYERITWFRIFPYLVILEASPNSKETLIAVPFKNLNPRKHILLEVMRTTNQLLGPPNSVSKKEV